MTSFTKFAIVGAGGVGSVVADGLLQNNATVTILTRDDTKVRDGHALFRTLNQRTIKRSCFDFHRLVDTRRLNSRRSKRAERLWSRWTTKTKTR